MSSLATTHTSVRAGLVAAAKELATQMDRLHFADPVTHVYNPLHYAWAPHQAYLELANDKQIRVLFLGMNPGPWGMAQTGVPFGEVSAVRDWIGIDSPVGKPKNEHPKRPIEGLQCSRSEVSGRRLWGLFRQRYKSPKAFFNDNLVMNYCPLVFMEESGRNRTPDKLLPSERERLQAYCDAHLAQAIRVARPDYLVGVGAYAEKAFLRVANTIHRSPAVVRILHPSPASPAANRDWEGSVTAELLAAKIWHPG